jgi:hypothetical protein
MENKKIIERLFELKMLVDKELEKQEKLDETFSILENSLNKNDVTSPEAGLLVLAMRQYRDTYPKYFNPRLKEISDKISNIANDVSTDEHENITKDNGGDTDGEEPSENEVKTRKTKKHYKKRVVKGFGRRITDDIAKNLIKKYVTPITYENYSATLSELNKSGTKISRDEIAKLTGISKNNVYAHLRYGRKRGDIMVDNNLFYITEQGKKESEYVHKKGEVTLLTKKQLTTPFQEEKQKLKLKLKIIKGTRIQGELAEEVSRKYGGTPLIKERMNRICHVLGQHAGYWATVEELMSITGLPKFSIYAHLRYGVMTNQIVLQKRKYITQQNYEKISQKVVRAESKSFLKELNKPSH